MLKKFQIGENGIIIIIIITIMLNTELLKHYKITPFLKPTKYTALINTNVKGVSKNMLRYKSIVFRDNTMPVFKNQLQFSSLVVDAT